MPVLLNVMQERYSNEDKKGAYFRIEDFDHKPLGCFKLELNYFFFDWLVTGHRLF